MKTTQENIFSSKTLTYFLQLTDTMNYTQAAQILGITQPALTQQIKKLERTVGTALFYSVGKKLRLTDAGYIMLKTTHQIYDLLNDATDEIQQATSSTTGQINLGILASIETKVFEDFALDLYKDNPDLEVNFHMLTRKEIWESLENNRIDLAIMYLPDESIKNWKPYSSKKIISDDLLFIHHNPKFADKKKIRLKYVGDRPWVMYPEDYYLNQTLRETFKNQMVDFPQTAARYTMPEQILKFAINTHTNTALPKSFLLNLDLNKMTDDDIWVTEFDPKIRFDLKFVYRKNKNEIPRIGRFLSKFDDYLAKKDYLSRLAK
ncbi:LysR family transcriptional regulator [Lentilactobacillus kisonensis]|uniref:Transcriptional regulator, LysR family n=2 Tax=Lentilactobacillus kisonensis TaxID=481722 RepID=H1LGA6_9LACO|nr:LysR family transcriptional regulator [Lentilactobacillus kisonensis]EHO51118.1 transcriptional regulator, LysR family [Lentilactobacillus kisonensis F0435]KRL23433.1 transcriptional regulator, LysR family [Lentilactobacillus kisonensis DSM 19906 = JCM 15041]